MAGARGLRVLIVGAGIGGIAAAIELRRHGFANLAILAKASQYQRAVTRLHPDDYE
jgi:cation diffusion facilitator CzcD-associated flavoprotein CzcO